MDTGKITAIDCAKWFVSDSSVSNLKLQKLLYFAQLISLSKYKRPLFDDEIFAFENGCVVESVRLDYNSRRLNAAEVSFTAKQIEVLKLTKEIFGNLDEKELTEINHTHPTWSDAYNNWLKNGSRYRHRSCLVLISELLKNEVILMGKVLDAYKRRKELEMDSIVVNGVTFYYNSGELSLDEGILNKLREFPAEESAYSIYNDSNLGLMIM